MKKVILFLFLLNIVFAATPLELMQMKAQYEELSKKKIMDISTKELLPPVTNTIDLNISSENEVDENITKQKKEDYKAKLPFIYNPSEDLMKNMYKNRDVREKENLKRFGENFFLNKNRLNSQNIPTPSYYILNSGDKVSISIYGLKNDEFNLEIDRNGELNIPSIGLIKIAGLSYEDMKFKVTKELEKGFPNSQIIINIMDYSSIQIMITGNVLAPGLYNLSSFSTIKDALIVSGGINKNGSYREIILKRDNREIERIDLYRLIKYGDTQSDFLLRNGDVLVVSDVKKEIIVSGKVLNPAIYELTSQDSFKELLDYAGGISYDANRHGIRLKRFNKNQAIEILTLSKDELLKLKPQNGDKLEIFSLHDNLNHSINIYGNIINEGLFEIPEDNSLHTLLKREIQKVGIRGFFLDNTDMNFAMVKRVDKERGFISESFNINSVLDGKTDIKLSRSDEIFIFNRLELKENQYVYVFGKVLEKATKYQYLSGMSLKDLQKIVTFRSERYVDLDDKNSTECKVFSEFELEELKDGSTQSQIVKLNPKIDIIKYKNIDEVKENCKRESLFVDLENVKIKRNSKDGTIFIVNLEKDNLVLEPFDEIEFFNYFDTHPKEFATINGEVFRSGEYEIDPQTTLAKLVKMAGGLTNKAFLEKFELIRYSVEDGERKRTVISKSLKEALDSDIKIMDGDEVIVFTIPKWNEKKYVEIKGQVKFPGKYALEDGEKLSNLIERAGGFRETAFLKGAIFTREDIRLLQEKKMKEAMSNLKQQAAILATQPTEAGERAEDKARLLQTIETIEKQSKENAPIGRVSIKLDNNISEFKNSQYDIALKDGDKLFIPTINDTVYVSGEVLNPNAFIYESGLKVYDYIQKAGGVKDSANEKSIYIVGANGEARKFSQGYLFNSNDAIDKGDTIIVPIVIDTASNIAIAKDVTSILYQLAVTAASLSTLGAI